MINRDTPLMTKFFFDFAGKTINVDEQRFHFFRVGFLFGEIIQNPAKKIFEQHKNLTFIPEVSIFSTGISNWVTRPSTSHRSSKMSDNSRRKRNRSNNLTHDGDITSSNNPIDDSNPIASNSSNSSQQMSTRRPPQSNAARDPSPFGMELRSREAPNTNATAEPTTKEQHTNRDPSKQQQQQQQQAEKPADTTGGSSFRMNLRS